MVSPEMAFVDQAPAGALPLRVNCQLPSVGRFSMSPLQTVGTGPDSQCLLLWNYGAVQSVTGGVILPDDKANVSTMLTFAGGQSGFSTMGIPGCTVARRGCVGTDSRRWSRASASRRAC